MAPSADLVFLGFFIFLAISLSITNFINSSTNQKTPGQPFFAGYYMIVGVALAFIGYKSVSESSGPSLPQIY